MMKMLPKYGTKRLKERFAFFKWVVTAGGGTAEVWLQNFYQIESFRGNGWEPLHGTEYRFANVVEARNALEMFRA